jgi:hypothetical protein
MDFTAPRSALAHKLLDGLAACARDAVHDRLFTLDKVVVPALRSVSPFVRIGAARLIKATVEGSEFFATGEDSDGEDIDSAETKEALFRLCAVVEVQAEPQADAWAARSTNTTVEEWVLAAEMGLDYQTQG